MSKRLGANIYTVRTKTLCRNHFGSESPMVLIIIIVTLGQQYHVGGKSTITLYCTLSNTLIATQVHQKQYNDKIIIGKSTRRSWISSVGCMYNRLLSTYAHFIPILDVGKRGAY